MAKADVEKAKMKLDIRPLDQTIRGHDKMWLFIKHTDPEESNLDLRWAIGYRKQGNWWGVIALFPATHERALHTIDAEMRLASEAIKILKNK